jgi:hypothetical protein
MVQLKKNTARLIVKGISLYGILLGFGSVCMGIGMTLSIQTDNLAFLCGGLVLSAVGLVLGPYLIYTSYRMFRGRAFGAIWLISVLSALLLNGVAVQSVRSFVATSVSGELPRHIELLGALAAPIGLFLCIYVFIKLSKRLLEVAYGPQETSGGGEGQPLN